MFFIFYSIITELWDDEMKFYFRKVYDFLVEINFLLVLILSRIFYGVYYKYKV